MHRDLVSPLFIGREAELGDDDGGARDARSRERRRSCSSAARRASARRGSSRRRPARPRAAGARVLAGSCVELGGEGLPFAPLADALRALMRDYGRRRSSTRCSARRAPELARLLPELDPDARRARRRSPSGADARGCSSSCSA